MGGVDHIIFLFILAIITINLNTHFGKTTCKNLK